MTCPCGLGESLESCCLPIIKGKKAPTAEALMRARYTAYALAEIDFLFSSLHPSSPGDADRSGTERWAKKSKWNSLEIVDTKAGGEDDEEGEVEFIARYTFDGLEQNHHERALFRKHEGRWYFVDGRRVSHQPVVRSGPRVGRNDPCPCGSGKKHKKCCGKAA